MSASQQALLGTYPAGDPYYDKVVFLANFNAGLVDAKGKTITATGNPTVNSTIPFAGTTSVKFDGTTASSLTLADSADWTFSGPFTYEGWYYRETGGDAVCALIDFGGVANNNNQASNVYLNNEDLYVVANSTVGGGALINGIFKTAAPRNQWNHYALTWDGSVYRAFFNGVLGLSFSSTTPTYDPNYGVLMGAYPDTTWNSNLYAKLKGALGPHRITKGVARYTSTFTAPGQALFPTS